MSVLLLRLAAPLQAWGSDSLFRARHTCLAPSKSGIVGLLAGAQGRPRDADISDLAALRFGSRTDQPGRVLRDYHTSHVPGEKNTSLSERYYLEDAVFVVGLEGKRDQLEECVQALRTPKFPLFLGRRSCPPAAPLVVGVEESSLEEALTGCAWQAADWFQRASARDGYAATLELETDRAPGTAAVNDQPVSFSKVQRRFTTRFVSRSTCVLCEPQKLAHDPFSALEGGADVSG